MTSLLYSCLVYCHPSSLAHDGLLQIENYEKIPNRNPLSFPHREPAFLRWIFPTLQIMKNNNCELLLSIQCFSLILNWRNALKTSFELDRNHYHAALFLELIFVARLTVQQEMPIHRRWKWCGLWGKKWRRKFRVRIARIGLLLQRVRWGFTVQCTVCTSMGPGCNVQSEWRMEGKATDNRVLYEQDAFPSLLKIFPDAGTNLHRQRSFDSVTQHPLGNVADQQHRD